MYLRRFILLVYVFTSISFVYADESVILTPATGGEAILQSSTNGEFTALSNIIFEETAPGQINPSLSDLVVNLPEGFEFDVHSKVNVTAVTSRIQNPELNCQGGNNRTLRLGTSQSGSLSVNVDPSQTSVTVSIKQATAGDCKGTLAFSGMKIRPTSLATQSGNITYNGTTNIFGIEPEETSLGVLTIFDDVPEDEVPPSITLNGSSMMSIEVYSEFIDPFATAIDSVDGEVEVVVSGHVDTTRLGDYVLTYSAIDSSSNASSITRTVKVVDTTPPEITLQDKQEMTLFVDETFIEPGFSASDNFDGDITHLVEIGSSLPSPFSVGEFNVLYTVTDTSGNTISKERKVNIISRGASQISVQPIIKTVSPQGSRPVQKMQNNYTKKFQTLNTRILPISPKVLGASTVCIKDTFVSPFSLSHISENQILWLRNFINKNFFLALEVVPKIDPLLEEALSLFALQQGRVGEELSEIFNEEIKTNCSSL